MTQTLVSNIASVNPEVLFPFIQEQRRTVLGDRP